VEKGECVAKTNSYSSLKMLLVMCCYQTSMLLLAMGVSVQMFEWQRKDRGAKKLVAPGLK